MTPPPIRLDGIDIAWQRHLAVRNVSGCFEPGSLTAIVGPNGAGKSTLLKALMGEMPLARGTIDSGGMSPRDFGYLPQGSELDQRFPMTVADTVLLGAWSRTGAFGGVSCALAEQARAALAAVGLEDFGQRTISCLSSGQFQRVLFARLLLQDAGVILLDEPFTAIDQRTTHDLLDIVLRWHEDGRTVIAVLHDVEQVRAYFPDTLLLAREVIAWGATSRVLMDRNIKKAGEWNEHAGERRVGT